MKDGSMLCRIALVWGVLLVAAHADFVTLSGPIFGTSYMVKVGAVETIDSNSLDSKIQSRLGEIDSRMSTYRDDSEVSRFSQAAASVWFPVSPETARLVQRANAISQETDGAFDITIGPVLALWKFGARQTDGGFQPPQGELIENALAKVGYEKLDVRLDPPALKKSVDGVEIDLSAIAKGYAVDSICELLAGFEHYMVEIGGEIRLRGARQDGTPWRIGLEAPTRDDRRVDSIVELDNTAMATSGDYRNFHVHDGVTYSHTIDPATGSPVKHKLASVTVLASDCATADALATAISVMGPERGVAWAEENSVKALLVSRDGDELVRSSTSGFPAVTQSEPAASGRESTGGFFGMFIVTAVVFGIAVLAMSIGTILANRRLQGSCGGMAGLQDSGGKTICDMCTKPSTECSGDPAIASRSDAASEAG